ncbi:hypothetical protein QR98_0024540 [Sarcoptes scabiei]|uniref:C2H2-type domain-containing protein n=1 Tax=Sarcoptes scabiei TaxID=52283 RepID=A0A132A0E0_SARSC|nr:hypothetical protein QR98_0024540 [Sarcoptes scabiei]
MKTDLSKLRIMVENMNPMLPQTFYLSDLASQNSAISDENRIVYQQQSNSMPQQFFIEPVEMQMTIQQLSNAGEQFVVHPLKTTDNNAMNGIQISKSPCPMRYQREIEYLKERNQDLLNEITKLHYINDDLNFQLMANNIKLTNYEEQLHLVQKDRNENEKTLRNMRVEETKSNSSERISMNEKSLFCDRCNFEVKANVAMFIHRLNHYFEKSLPKHLQLSTRSFTTMPDDSIDFKYNCYCCEIDANRKFAKHELYMHIYQYHTFDLPFKCKLCFLYFTSKSYLNDHLVEKHSVSNSQFKYSRINSKYNTHCPDINISSFESDNEELVINPDQINSKLASYLQEELSDQQTVSNLNSEAIKVKEIQSYLNRSKNESVHVRQSLQTSECKADNSNYDKSSKDAQMIITESIITGLNDKDSLNCKYPGCQFVATNKNHLKFHINAHLTSKYKCPYCTFVANRIIEIKRHILKSTKHADQHVFLCEGCDFGTDSEKNFREHYSRSHNSSASFEEVIERMFSNETKKVKT